MSDRDASARPGPRRVATAFDGVAVERLNQLWRVQGPDVVNPTWKQRLVRPLRRAFASLLRPQETFNSAVVQYVNGSITALDTALEHFDAIAAHVRRYQEALDARERRVEAAMTAMRAEHDELRTAIGILQQQIRSNRSDRSERSDRSDRSTVPNENVSNDPNVPNPNVSNDPNVSNVLSEKYVGFEDQFRGTPEQIRSRLTGYLPIFEGASDVLDVGCGRGEFLLLLREHGISGRGIDLNEAMVEVCRGKALDATYADALGYLRAQPDQSLGGLFAAQVVEHLEPAYLTHVIDVAFDKLRPGAAIVLETINPACWFAFFESYIRDITHVRPLHPDTLKFLLVATGFQQIDIQYRAPYPEHEKLQHVAAFAGGTDVAETLNANVDKLNSLMFTYLDYAAVARRP